MTKTDIITMAKDSGFQEGWLNLWAANFERFAELVEEKAVAAAEARNATLTDDAARLDYLIDGEGSRCWVLPVLQGAPSKEGYCLQWMDCHDRITWQEGFFATARAAIDAAIQARAAASISTKGDGHAS